MIRLKYANIHGKVECYTCYAMGNWQGDGFHVGHLIPGRSNSMLCNEKVVRIQCPKCNLWNGGEQYKFGKRMESEIGEENVKKLWKLKKQTVQMGKKEWEAMTKVFKEKAKMYAEEKGLTI
jgi:hypothetical protein